MRLPMYQNRPVVDLVNRAFRAFYLTARQAEICLSRVSSREDVGLYNKGQLEYVPMRIFSFIRINQNGRYGVNHRNGSNLWLAYR
ncbi:hypothetical protein KCU81_g871, partial [Aureobasidium melanogenum]